MCFCTEFNIFVGTPTLLRKRVASAADNDEDTKAVKKTLAALSAHSVGTMDKHINLSKAESDARRAAAAQEALMQGTAPWLEENVLSSDVSRAAFKRALDLSQETPRECCGTCCDETARTAHLRQSAMSH